LRRADVAVIWSAGSVTTVGWRKLGVPSSTRRRMLSKFVTVRCSAALRIPVAKTVCSSM
jgi:hypothetical protein